MGSLWRSEPMQLVQLFVQIEAAHYTVDELGQIGVVQFRDLNPHVSAFHRNFVNEVKRCDEMERKLRFFEEQVIKEKGLNVTTMNLEAAGQESHNINIDDLEGRFEELEKEMLTLNNNQQLLGRNLNELIELQHVLSADSVFFAQAHIDPEQVENANNILLGEMGEGSIQARSAVKLGYVTGVIHRAKVPSFERVLWRTTRGNLYMKQTEIPEPIKDPMSGNMQAKNVFIIFFQGDRLQVKIKKICESFGASLYLCPEGEAERLELTREVNNRLADLEQVLERSQEQRRVVLVAVANQLPRWKAKILKEKAIYHTMNMFNYDVGRKCLIAEGWCPVTASEDIQLALRRASQRANALVPSILSIAKTIEVPPTHFNTNKFTHAYQEIVNAYGMAHYREVNPAVITLVTFPFLFGVMFGDVGHGIFLLIFSLLLIRNEQYLSTQKLNEIIQMPFDGRYVLVIMSLYAIFTGFIYNEFFSVPMNIFGSAWAEPTMPDGSKFNWTDEANSNYTYLPIEGKVYPFGVDPVWKGAPNELDYYNSFKMKLSILLGIIQMTLGIVISCLNYTVEKQPMKRINILYQFVPQIIFLWAIFGYMCLLIIIKWCTDWGDGPAPPSILPLIINMFLSPGLAPELDFFPGQHGIQILLMVVAVLCIPVMLLVKPLLLRKYNKKHGHHHRMEQDEEEPNVSVAESSSHEHGEEFEFAEVLIHQIIHTIEFVLGCISNTASYLRLWALSLAHSELSTVFWNRVMMHQIQGQNVIFIFAAFAVWAAATFSVLLIMETLSAFLHALRLHWVEFQNKFYLGDGVRFIPFSYKKLLNGELDNTE
jgi:V-type H+-transporting ATPase subunit a